MEKSLLSKSEFPTNEVETLQLSETAFLTLEEILQNAKITNPSVEDLQVPENLGIYACQHCKHTCRGGCSCMLLG